MGRVKIEIFIFSLPDEPYKYECTLCGANIAPYPLAIHLYAVGSGDDEKHVYSDQWNDLCPSCVLGTPKEAATNARANADRLEAAAFRLEKKKTGNYEDKVDTMRSIARDIRAMAFTLEGMRDFSRLPNYEMAMNIARFYAGKRNRKAA